MSETRSETRALNWVPADADWRIVDWLQLELGVQSRADLMRLAIRSLARERGWPGDDGSHPIDVAG
jgi:hypothetical protein